MPKCPNCGREGLLLKTQECVYCGKKRCSDCGIYVLTYYLEDKRVCSEECFAKFRGKVLDYPLKGIGTDLNAEFYSLVNQFWSKACMAALRDDDFVRVRARYVPYTHTDIKTQSSHGKHRSDLRDKFNNQALLALAHNMEAVGRPLDAAVIYEKNLKMYDKARELRDKEKQFIVKKMDVSVDLNELLQQVKDGGIVAVYRCPHCGGKLKIGKDTRIDSLRTCEYCGSTIEGMDIADFLRTVLS